MFRRHVKNLKERPYSTSNLSIRSEFVSIALFLELRGYPQHDNGAHDGCSQLSDGASP